MGKRKQADTGAPKHKHKEESKLPHVSKKESWSLIEKELYQDRLFTVDGVLTQDECQQLIDVAERISFQHQGSLGAAHGEAFRDNHRIALVDTDFAEQLWDRCGLKDVCCSLTYQGRSACGLNPNLRFYRYAEGQRFGKHVDGSQDLPGGLVTGYTLLVYLNGRGSRKGSRPAKGGAAAAAGLSGGETVFYDERGARMHAVAPQAGMALLHLHGDECLEHEGAAVQAGVKYVLRSDVVFA
eukprot:jgi/Ulvmu1/2561/UM014_0012.1